MVFQLSVHSFPAFQFSKIFLSFPLFLDSKKGFSHFRHTSLFQFTTEFFSLFRFLPIFGAFPAFRHYNIPPKSVQIFYKIELSSICSRGSIFGIICFCQKRKKKDINIFERRSGYKIIKPYVPGVLF